MTVALSTEKKAEVITFSAEGETVNVEVNRDGQMETVKDLKNHGETVLTFPKNYTGSCEISVQGSKPGSDPDKGTITVS